VVKYLCRRICLSTCYFISEKWMVLLFLSSELRVLSSGIHHCVVCWKSTDLFSTAGRWCRGQHCVSAFLKRFLYTVPSENQDSSVDTEKGYGPGGRGSISGRSKGFLSSPQLWGSLSLLSNSGLLPRGAADLIIVERSRMVDLYLHSLIHLHDVVLT
jgi:hypothetical protein